jgi:hypothetical protein
VRRSALLLVLWLIAGLGPACGGRQEPSAEVSKPAETSHVLPSLEERIFVPRCAGEGCHRGARAAGNLDLSKGAAYRALVGVRAERRPDRLRVRPGAPEGSYLLERLVEGGDTPTMPVGSAVLAPEEVEEIRRWIREGAAPG